jgi:hypothetical protein
MTSHQNYKHCQHDQPRISIHQQHKMFVLINQEYDIDQKNEASR